MFNGSLILNDYAWDGIRFVGKIIGSKKPLDICLDMWVILSNQNYKIVSQKILC